MAAYCVFRAHANSGGSRVIDKGRSAGQNDATRAFTRSSLISVSIASAFRKNVGGSLSGASAPTQDIRAHLLPLTLNVRRSILWTLACISSFPWKLVHLSASFTSLTLIFDTSWSEAAEGHFSSVAFHPTKPPGDAPSTYLTVSRSLQEGATRSGGGVRTNINHNNPHRHMSRTLTAWLFGLRFCPQRSRVRRLQSTRFRAQLSPWLMSRSPLFPYVRSSSVLR